MRIHRLFLASVAATGVVACSDSAVTPTPLATAVAVAGLNVADSSAPVEFSREPGDGGHEGREMEASGDYRFFVPADFNGGIFGGSVDNDVVFDAEREPNGKVTGHFHYVQIFAGQPNTYSGKVTCLAIYDTPVLQRFPDIPAKTQNRAKWGGVIEHSTDPTEPVGTFIWFQSIDNNTPPHRDNRGEPDLSTLSGFGDNTANEAFCASSNVPNPNFGPHAVQRGNISVR